MSSSRFSRQEKLAEVGAAGQARIERASLTVGAGRGAMTEVAYLVRAGVPRVTVSAGEKAEPFAHAESFHFEATRADGAGAWRAIRAIRAALGISSP